MFHKLSKKISRKNLYRYIDIYIDKIQKEKNGLDNIKVLNIGSGGEIQNYLKKKLSILLLILFFDFISMFTPGINFPCLRMLSSIT